MIKLIFLLVSSFQTQGWYIYYAKVFMVSNQKATWSVARECCQKKHVKCDLASIQNDNQRKFISPYTPSDSWIGAEKNKEIWSWTDGTPWSYTNWQTGKPNPDPTTSNVAVHVSSGGRWHDAWKTGIYNFVCQCVNEYWPFSDNTNKYYKAFSDAGNWEKGRNSCLNKCDNGDLASIPDQITMDFIISNFGGWDIWIGAEYKSGAWSWSDGTNWNYTNWNTGLDLEQIGFGVQLKDGKWENKDKSASINQFICQCPK